MHCDYCSKRHCDYCFIALEHFAVVNKAEHHTTSVNIIAININTLSVNKNILVSVSFLMLRTQSYSIPLQYLAIFCIAHAILLTCKNACDIIIAWT